MIRQISLNMLYLYIMNTCIPQNPLCCHSTGHSRHAAHTLIAAEGAVHSGRCDQADHSSDNHKYIRIVHPVKTIISIRHIIHFFLLCSAQFFDLNVTTHASDCTQRSFCYLFQEILFSQFHSFTQGITAQERIRTHPLLAFQLYFVTSVSSPGSLSDVSSFTAAAQIFNVLPLR